MTTMLLLCKMQVSLDIHHVIFKMQLLLSLFITSFAVGHVEPHKVIFNFEVRNRKKQHDLLGCCDSYIKWVRREELVRQKGTCSCHCLTS